MDDQYSHHIKKRNKMPPFLCKYKELERKSMKGGVLSPWLRSFLCGVFCLVCLQGVESCLAATDPGEVFSALVTQVIDGDTIEVMHQGKRVRVRLWGIDTPEWQQEFSHEARAFTLHRVQGRRVELLSKAWDKYGRLVAMVKVGGSSLNEELLREGLAWVHIYYCKEPICRGWRRMEKEARTARRGLWQKDNPLPPWKWKQRHK
jgi:micrococcal nuclease